MIAVAPSGARKAMSSGSLTMNVAMPRVCCRFRLKADPLFAG